MRKEKEQKNLKEMKILILGDVSRLASCEYLKKKLPAFKRENQIALTVVNGENSAEGNGIDKESAELLFYAGADVITTGNHAFRRYEAKRLFEENPNILRPGNFPGSVPGDGAVLVECEGLTVLVMNLLGTVMMEPLENPFFAADRLLRRYEGQYDLSILDIHAEATAEKRALGFYLDGRLTAVYGTHTHVETADETILPKGTAYITDIGMCGPDLSILGIEPSCIIEKLTTGLPVKFIPAEKPITAHGIVLTVDKDTKKAISVERITF